MYFFKIFFTNLNLFDLIVVNICKFRSYERSEFQVHLDSSLDHY